MTKKEQRIKKLTEYLQRLGSRRRTGRSKKRFYKRIFGCTGIGDHGGLQELMKQGTPLEEVQRLVMCMQHCFTVLCRKKR